MYSKKSEKRSSRTERGKECKAVSRTHLISTCDAQPVIAMKIIPHKAVFRIVILL